MIIRTKKTWKELCDTNVEKHDGVGRRDFLQKGLATGVMSICLPNLVTGRLIEKASAADLSCPAPAQVKGAIAQIYAEGGPTMGARFIGEAQAQSMSAGMASNYGISGAANLVKIGTNLYVDKTSPFGAALLLGPRGWVGGQAAWKSQVLDKIVGGGHLGQFSADDGAGQNSGLIGLSSGLKTSVMGKDISVGVGSTLAAFAQGMSVAAVNSATVANFARTFTLTPAAAGLISSSTMDLASDAANGISDGLALALETGSRKAASIVKTSAGCGFYGNSPMADPNYGTRIFTPNDARLISKINNITALSAEEQAYLGAYFQSALGFAGGVFTEYGGRDYHGSDPLTNVAVKDIQEARNIVMFLAACAAADAPGAIMYTSNGQAIANGVTNGNVNIEGQAVNVNGPNAAGDAGGSYNAGLIIMFSPTGNLPNSKLTGTVDSNGNCKIDPNVGSSKEAMTGLYASAVAFVNNGSIPLAIQSKLPTTAGLSKIMVI